MTTLHTAPEGNEDDSWWDDKVEELIEQAEAHYGSPGDEEGAADRYLLHLRALIDTAIEQLQSFALHNPCGDGEVIELEGGVEACAGCFDADGNPRG